MIFLNHLNNRHDVMCRPDDIIMIDVTSCFDETVNTVLRDRWKASVVL